VGVCTSAPWLNLDLSMYPSFASALYDWVEPGYWVKSVGVGAGEQVVYYEGGRLCCSGPGCSAQLLARLSGAWCRRQCMWGLDRALAVNPGLRVLARAFEGLVVSASPPGDEVVVASAVVLSQRTRYATNVRRWVREVFGGPRGLEGAVERASRMPSPQPRILAGILPRLALILEEAQGDPWALRSRLLELPGVGPKVADAILLFTGATTSVAPADVHLERFAREALGLGGWRPSKARCKRGGFNCASCRFRGSCLSGAIVSAFDGASGLVQTMAYVYGTLGLEWRSRLHRVLSRFYTSSAGRPSGV